MTSYRDILLKSPPPSLKVNEGQCKVNKVEKWTILSRSREVSSEAPPEAPARVVVVPEREIQPQTQRACSQDVQDRVFRQRWVKKYRKLKAGTATDRTSPSVASTSTPSGHQTIERQEEEKAGSYFRQAALARLKKASAAETETEPEVPLKKPNHPKKKKVKNQLTLVNIPKPVSFDTDSDTTLWSLARKGLHKEASVFIRTLLRKNPQVLDEATLSKVLHEQPASSSSDNIFHVIAARGDVTFLRMILPLFCVNLKGDDDHVFLLKTYFNQPDSKSKSTPVHVAAKGGHIELVKIFLRRGANPRMKDAGGNTILHLAAAHGHERLVDALVCTRAFQGQLDRKNKSGQTPLLLACVTQANAGAARRLLKAGAKLDIVDRYNQYPLLGAIRSGDEMLVQSILRRGAKVSPLFIY